MSSKPGREPVLRGMLNRLLQELARKLPGATSLRIWLNRWRGVKIGSGVWIGYDTIIETSKPHLVTIKDGASIGLRCTIVAHHRELHGVMIEEDADIGTGVIILPGVTIGRGAAVTAGSVVTKSVPPMILVQGNPAVPIAKVGIPLKLNVTVREWIKHLKPIRK
jgi:heptaprenylglycerol acetyltransferase